MMGVSVKETDFFCCLESEETIIGAKYIMDFREESREIDYAVECPQLSRRRRGTVKVFS